MYYSAVTHPGVTADLQAAENPRTPFDDDCSYLGDGRTRRGQNVSDPEEGEDAVAVIP